ncbi:MAG: hypothetical protein U9Q82_08845, partial [Chloroflexota bacterium]|nr:hypothetical protein [Chloroflexota bacterium]
QLGFSAWALCGLGYISDRDLKLLRQRPVVYLAMDGDKQGQRQQRNMAATIGPLAMLVKPFQEYKDANELYQDNPDPRLIIDKLEEATPVIEERLDRIKNATPHELQDLTAEVVFLLEKIPDELAPRYKKRTSRALGMTRKELRRLMSGVDQQSDNGRTPILSDVKDGTLSFLGESLGNFTARITTELTIDDGMNIPEVQYTLTGRLAAGTSLRSVDVPAEEFSSMKWINKYWGARPIMYVSRGKYYLLARAIQEVSLDEMEQERVYTYTGWSEIDGERSYLTASGRITASGSDDKVRVDLGQNNLSHYSLSAPPSGKALDAAVKASLDFLKLGPRSVTAPIWAAMYASPLTEMLPLYTAMWLYGHTC